MKKKFAVIKESGEEEAFNKGKFCQSLSGAGAPSDVVDYVCESVSGELHPGITTNQIFRIASRELMRKNFRVGARYNLRRGVARLGPAGFIFEQFVETLLQSMGYQTNRNQQMRGECVTHEVDVVARKGDEHFLVEAKFRNKMSIKTHVDVVMYAYARLLDIAGVQEKTEKNRATHNMWVVTNTKFTKNAIDYAQCKNMRLMGWNFPSGAGLEDIVEDHMLYPITVLPSVDNVVRELLLPHNIILARDLAPLSEKNLIKQYNIKEHKAKRIIRDAHKLVYGN